MKMISLILLAVLSAGSVEMSSDVKSPDLVFIDTSEQYMRYVFEPDTVKNGKYCA